MKPGQNAKLPKVYEVEYNGQTLKMTKNRIRDFTDMGRKVTVKSKALRK